ncbi:MAG: xanthine dehydrogenase family protein subunit M [Candidatus Bathyarchaeia archaeon]|nr:MAG: molybdopterin dehydrogenase [Candidatus Nezhaarchaeota archaeon WYZ-LMO8]
MKRFEHFNAKTIDEAILLLEKYDGEAKVIAGGTDLIRVLKDDILPKYPKAIINLKTIANLEYIKEENGVLKIGSLTRLSDVASSSLIKTKYNLLSEACRSVGTPQIRNMGTIGGNLCQDVQCWYYRASKSLGKVFHCLRKGGNVCYAVSGDNRFHSIFGGKGCVAVCPSDVAIALTALDALVKTKGPLGERVFPVSELYKDAALNLGRSEIVTEIQVPEPPPEARQIWIKFRLRNSLDFAIVSVAVMLTLEEGVCKDVRIALGGVAPTPKRLKEVEDFLKGNYINSETAEKAGKMAVAKAFPLSHNAYKIPITESLVKRVILMAKDHRTLT